MKALILGATGGIGKHVLTRLLEREVTVTVIVRSASRLPESARENSSLFIVEMPDGHLKMDLSEHIRGCDAVISCLGHNLTFKGMFQHPRKLCTDTSKQVCEVIRALAPKQRIKYIVCSTEGISIPSDAFRKSRFERFLLWLLEKLLPPHLDNVLNAKYLRTTSSNPHVAFCAVRPSDLLDATVSSPFTLHSTLQNGILNAGTTTRANVGEFMADLTTKPDVWAEWKGQFPHILDVPSVKKKAS